MHDACIKGCLEKGSRRKRVRACFCVVRMLSSPAHVPQSNTENATSGPHALSFHSNISMPSVAPGRSAKVPVRSLRTSVVLPPPPCPTKISFTRRTSCPRLCASQKWARIFALSQSPAGGSPSSAAAARRLTPFSSKEPPEGRGRSRRARPNLAAAVFGSPMSLPPMSSRVSVVLIVSACASFPPPSAPIPLA